MTLVRWEPLHNLGFRTREIDRVWDRFFGPFAVEHTGARVPPIDVSEDEAQIVVKVELPGMSDKEIDVTVKDNALIIKGEKKREKEEKGERYHLVERSFGTFSRSIALSADVDHEKVKAKFKNGVLKIVLPKSEAAKPKKVEIN